MIEWHKAIELFTPHVVRISTPTGRGTGFLVSRSKGSAVCAIATAAHVIAHAFEWDEPIRLQHHESGNVLTLRPGKGRAIVIDKDLDTAAIVFDATALSLPAAPFDLIGKGEVIKAGVELGWLGFPAISPDTLCFFGGPVSALIDHDNAYLIDGVAINGVSGGPVLWRSAKSVELVGVVSAYIPNRATGETLPGLAVVRHVKQLQEIVEHFKSVDDALEQQRVNEEALRQIADQVTAPPGRQAEPR